MINLEGKTMAKDEEEILEDEEEKKAPKKKGNLMKILVIVLSTIILVAASIGGTLFLTGGMSGGGGGQVEVASSDEGSEVEVDEDEEDEGEEKAMKETFYYALDPSFIVNYYDGKKIRYLQVTVEVMAYDESVIEDVKKHSPVIKSNLILMLSNIDSEIISSIAGKKKLINDALAEVRGILEEKTGKPGVEEVYFTGFVMQ